MPDKDDNDIIALAVSAKADLIITGDKDLLVLKNINLSNPISPEFWEVERQGQEGPES